MVQGLPSEDGKRVQRRSQLRGTATLGPCPIARSARCGSRLRAAYFVVGRGQKVVPSLLLSTAARDPWRLTPPW